MINAYISLANTLVAVRKIYDEMWLRYRWYGRPDRMPHAWGGRTAGLDKSNAKWAVKTVAEREAEVKARDPRWQVKR